MQMKYKQDEPATLKNKIFNKIYNHFRILPNIRVNGNKKRISISKTSFDIFDILKYIFLQINF